MAFMASLTPEAERRVRDSYQGYADGLLTREEVEMAVADRILHGGLREGVRPSDELLFGIMAELESGK